MVSDGSPEEQLEIVTRNLRRKAYGTSAESSQKVSVEAVLAARQRVAEVHLPMELLKYALALKNHDPDGFRLQAPGNRAFEAIVAGAQARAYLEGRGVISEEDLRQAFPGAMRHRTVLKPEAQRQKVTVEDTIADALRSVPVPAAE